jgi:DNA-binding NtrC family response regulator
VNAPGILEGRRILLVEDQFIIALELERVLTRAGCVVIGPVARLKKAIELARLEELDFAILDVNLFGEKVFPVADILQTRAIPFLLTTGYGEAAVPAGRQGWRVVSKPYDSDKVRDLIAAELAA